MKAFLVIAAAASISACAARAPYSPERPRAWLSQELRRSPGLVILAGCRLELGVNSPDGQSRVSASARLNTKRDVPLISMKANAEGSMVRLVASEPALRAQPQTQARGAAWSLWSSGPIIFHVSSNENAARVATGLNDLSQECAATAQ